MIRVFASDLDGTLLNKDHSSDDLVLEGIDAVLEANKTFVVATGRAIREARGEYGFSDRELYYVCLNGAIMYDPKGNVLHKEPIDKKVVEEFLDTFWEEVLQIQDEDTYYCNRSIEEFEETFLQSTMISNFKAFYSDEEILQLFNEKRVFSMTKEELLKKDIYKLDAFKEDYNKDKFDTFIKEHKEIVDAPSMAGNYELTSSKADKKQGICYLLDILQVKEEEVAVFGDDKNDVCMLSYFPHSYAPSDASSYAKEKASAIIGANKEYGVIKKIKELVEEK